MPVIGMENDRKRKRLDSDITNLRTEDGSSTTPTSTSTTASTDIDESPTDVQSHGKKNQLKPSLPVKKRDLVRKTSSPLPPIPWPEPFKSLAQTHRALNVVYTFCCTRKHFATTFENIKNAVESQNGDRKLSVEDVAKVKVLVPASVRFEVADVGIIDMTSARERGEGGFGSVWGDWEAEVLGAQSSEGDSGRTDGALVFEFVDGDLKIERQRASSGSSRRKPPEEDLNIPVYSRKHMTKLIEKRNKKFSDAINAYLADCVQKRLDPVICLESEKELFMPQYTQSGQGTPVAAKIPAQIPKERKDISEIIAEIREQDWYSGQIVPDGHRVFEAQSPKFGDLNFAMSQNLVNALYNTRGITQLYSHQAEAINNLNDGHNVIVSTSTSSGKSLIYQIPMLHELEKDGNSRGMYIFPTKALAQDQRQSMQNMLQYMEDLAYTMVETFDGDTPMSKRNAIRDEARIIFTNPDMLHVTILPHEQSWRKFLANLKFVVVDELHVYNGLFGSHVALVMRRLRRICASVGNDQVKFVSCSATVANPEAHMKTIFGVDNVKLTDIDGSPSGKKEFLCWNTPFKDPGDPSSGRASSFLETSRLFCQLILRGVRVIAFCRVRKQCEILLSSIKDEFRALDRANIAKFVMGYRGGYSPQDRRRIEREMFEGKLLGIVATSALELGVDIGSLDAVITHGFPYSISNLRQQSGRAGRRNKDSLSILVGDSFATDQHYMRNPDELFTRPNCELQVDMENELVLEGHIQCAAFEIPIRLEADLAYFGPQLAHLAGTRLAKDSSGLYLCHERFRPYPSRCISIRDTEEDHYAVIDTTNSRNAVIEEIEDSRVFFTIYEGAIFLHQGNTYLVKELNPAKRYARVSRVNVDWTTQQRDITDVDPIETESIRRVSPFSESKAFFGAIRISTVVYGYFKMDKRGMILDAVEIDHAPIDKLSKGMWLDIPRKALDILTSHNLNIAAAIHAAEHAMMSLLPTFVISSPGDIRTECKVAKKELGPKHIQAAAQSQQNKSSHDAPRSSRSKSIVPPPRRQRPARLTFYDTKGGSAGSGITSKAFEFIDNILIRAHKRIESCPCVEPRGCVECVCDEHCKERNVVMSKAGALVVLKCLLGFEVDVDSLPWGTEFGESLATGSDDAGELAGGLETVVEAIEVSGTPGMVKTYGFTGG